MEDFRHLTYGCESREAGLKHDVLEKILVLFSGQILDQAVTSNPTQLEL